MSTIQKVMIALVVTLSITLAGMLFALVNRDRTTSPNAGISTPSDTIQDPAMAATKPQVLAENRLKISNGKVDTAGETYTAENPIEIINLDGARYVLQIDNMHEVELFPYESSIIIPESAGLVSVTDLITGASLGQFTVIE